MFKYVKQKMYKFVIQKIIVNTSPLSVIIAQVYFYATQIFQFIRSI